MLKASKHEAPLKIRFPYRVVRDDDVDRSQVQGRERLQPSDTNHPNPFRGADPPRKKNRVIKTESFLRKALVLKLQLPSWHLFLRYNVKRVMRDPEDDGKKKLRW